MVAEPLTDEHADDIELLIAVRDNRGQWESRGRVYPTAAYWSDVLRTLGWSTKARARRAVKRCKLAGWIVGGEAGGYSLTDAGCSKLAREATCPAGRGA